MKHARMLFGISIYWLALSMLFDGINALFLPNSILNMVGEDNSATILGLITFVGLMLGMLFQPVAGVLSDQTYGRWGRKGIIALGSFFTIIMLALLTFSSTIFVLLAAFIGFQFAMNLAQAAQQGFIPDLVNQEQRGTASGIKGFMDLAGAMLGFILLAELLANEQKMTAAVIMATVLLITLLLTFLLVKENRAKTVEVFERPSLLDTFRFPVAEHGAFVKLVLARFFFLLGIYAVGRFFLLFIAARLELGAAEATQQAGSLLAALTLISVLATIPAGWAADRFGRRPLMLVGILLGAAGIGSLIFANAGWQILLFGSLMSLGSAAFVSANWAYTADVVPANEAGRFMGIANFGTAGAAAVVGLLGPVIDWANTVTPAAGYSLLFVIAIITILISSIPVFRIQKTDIPESKLVVSQ